MQLRAKALTTGLTVGALVALGAMLIGGTTAASAGSNAGAAAKCKEAKNVQAIIDDSSSMLGEDPQKFRTAFLNTFANISANNGRVFGGNEFGTQSYPLFGPGTIPGIIPAMQNSFQLVEGDGAAHSGGASTSYQDGFAGATAMNGAADARIFLTDGAPNSYPTSHLSPLVKTYVIGIGSFAAGSEGGPVLSQLAAETGGPPPFLITDASQIQPVAGTITAALDCKKIQTFIDILETQGDQAKHQAKPASVGGSDVVAHVAKGGKKKKLDILTTWGTVGTIINVVVDPVGKGGKVKKTFGSNFVSVSVKGLQKGQKVKIKIKAKALAIPTTVTTQVIK